MPTLERPDARHRQWTTIDGMILVAATGTGLVGVRETYRTAGFAWGFPGQTNVRWGATLAQITMLAWAVALLAIGRNRRSGPAWRMLRSPGLAACAFGLAGAAYVLLMGRMQRLLPYVRGLPVPYRGPVLDEVSQTYLSSGYFVLISWLTLLATGVWRPSPGWDDRIGRFVGLAWVVLMLLVTLGL
jgi:hypothetical protein